MGSLIRELGLGERGESSGYDHEIGLDDWDEYERVSSGFIEVTFEVSASEAAHLLLSDSNRADEIRTGAEDGKVFEHVVRVLSRDGSRHSLQAQTWARRYRLLG